jgi:hypothetical protein
LLQAQIYYIELQTATRFNVLELRFEAMVAGIEGREA